MSGTFTQEWYTFLKKGTSLFAVVNIGGTGAPTLEKWQPNSAQITAAYSAAPTTGNAVAPAGFQGVASIARVSAGLYTIVLQQGYQRLLGVFPTFLVTTTGSPAAPIMGVIKPTAAGGLTASGTTFQVQFWATQVTKAIIDGDATATLPLVATDPASGEQIILEIIVDASGAI